MKILLSRRPREGPWGGGNKIVTMLFKELKRLGHDICFSLEPGIDLIFCFDPRRNEYNETFLNYEDYRKNNTGVKIVQRVGDVGSHSKPDLTQFVKYSVNISDYIIFTSQWAKEYVEYQGDNCCVIPNGPLPIFYKNRNKNKQIDKEKVKIVTHHWSDNDKKGFDVYAALGYAIKEDLLKNIEFTYIGRYSKKFKSEGIKLVEPKDQNGLSKILPQHDIYLTASLEEAGANHVLEAIACGLPVIYRKDGGSINEYCRGYGIEYQHDFDNFVLSLKELISNYEKYKDKSLLYTRKTIDVVKEYVEVLDREKITEHKY